MKLSLSSLLATMAIATVTFTATPAVDAASLYARQVPSTSPTRAAFRLVTDADPNMCLGSKGNSADGTKNGLSPIFWSCADSPGNNAIWEYDFLEGTLTTRADPSQCLGAKGNNQDGTSDLSTPIFWSCAGSPGLNARWLFDAVSGRLYTKEKTTQCLGSAIGRDTYKIENGAPPVFWPCKDTGTNFAWNFQHVK